MILCLNDLRKWLPWKDVVSQFSLHTERKCVFLGLAQAIFSQVWIRGRGVDYCCETEPPRFLKKLETCLRGGLKIQKVNLRGSQSQNAFALFPDTAQGIIVLTKETCLQKIAQLQGQQGQRIWADHPRGSLTGYQGSVEDGDEKTASVQVDQWRSSMKANIRHFRESRELSNTTDKDVLTIIKQEALCLSGGWCKDMVKDQVSLANNAVSYYILPKTSGIRKRKLNLLILTPQPTEFNSQDDENLNLNKLNNLC